MNVKRLRKIQKIIRADASRIDMLDWGGSAENSCGTVACIAGWGWTIERLEKNRLRFSAKNISHRYVGDPQKRGRKALGLTATQTRNLFVPSGWPQTFRDRYYFLDQGTPEYAELVCEVIDDFIAHGDDPNSEWAKG